MEEKKNNKKKILIYSILGVVTLLIVTLTITYAYWILTRQQTGENVVNTACLNISFTGENDITLDKAYPMNPEQLEKFLSTETPYHFTIHNECSELASASINLESLTISGKALEDEYIDAILYEDDYNSNLNSIKKLTSDILNDENKVIIDAKHAYSLYNFNLKPDETRDFNLLLYMDPETPMVDANMNASWKGKITLSTEYKEDSKSLRKISYDESNGMWGYKDKLTKIVIEDSKSVKEALDGGKVYGPFDESEYGTKAVESYVVCDADDANCIGYLQSDGKVIANSDSSNLFSNFSNVTTIEGLEKLNTFNVINMANMFLGMKNLESINLAGFNTSNVKNISNMFSNCSTLLKLDLSSFDVSNINNIDSIFSRLSKLQELDLSNWIFSDNITSNFTLKVGLTYSESLTTIKLNNVNTSNVSHMNYMFSKLNALKTLDLSYFDTSKVLDMSRMFDSSISLTNITFGDNFTTNKVQNMNYMFFNCSNLQELDLSDWDTSSVSDMAEIFGNTSNLQSITFGSNFVHKQGAITTGMFNGCLSQNRPSDESWQDVSFS